MAAPPILAWITIVPLIPYLGAYIVRFLLRSVGNRLRRKTSGKKDIIFRRVRAEDQHLQSEQQATLRQEEDEDDDWEGVDSSAAGTAPNGDDYREKDFEGLVGFFHPFCNAGGGGERVLWTAIRATQQRWPQAVCVVYCGDHDVEKTVMIKRVYETFGIKLHAPSLVFLYLSTRHLVLPSAYPHFTLLGQSLGSLVVAYDAFDLLVPDIFIDTMGYAFALAFATYLFPSMPTAAYVHYPVISTDMLESLDDKSGERGINAGAGSGLRGKAKKLYWHLFARLYGWVGSHIDVVMCNSTWTKRHIQALWKPKDPSHKSSFAKVVYPPCPVEEMQQKITVSADSEKSRQDQILYIAQFRPEKNHPLILRSFAAYIHDHPRQPPSSPPPHLVLIGSVRANTSDDLHIYTLRLLAHELGIDTMTSFITDAPYPTVLQYLQTSSIGTNGMWNEHFGIGVVEYLAAGVIPVVHDSGGPKLDIVISSPTTTTTTSTTNAGKGETKENQNTEQHSPLPTGFHATTSTDFAAGFAKALAMTPQAKLEMRLRGRSSAKRFTEEMFARSWVAALGTLVERLV